MHSNLREPRTHRLLSLKLSAALVCTMAIVGAAQAQIATQSIDGGVVTAVQMANVLAGSSVTVSNVTYTGAPIAGGIFSGGLAPIGIESGIILSSGAIANVVGPNNVSNSSTDNNRPGDADLNTLVSGSTRDAAVLEFDFVSTANATITFRYVFGSEEYNEFVNTGFNDVFALFVNGQNCAMIPGTADPVSINTVNAGSNSAFYVNNSVPAPVTKDTQLDGLTTVLQCIATVIPGATNHLKLAIADRNDDIYDSDIFLQTDSLVAGFAPTAALSVSPSSGPAPLGASFSTAGTDDQDGPLANYSLDFGDGTAPSTGSGDPPATVPHTYATDGSFTATLTVTDSDGNTSSATAAVAVGIVTGADLVFDKIASVGSVAQGATFNYTLSVFNHGPGTADNVVVTDVLPASVGHVFSIATQGGCGEFTGTVTCNLGDLAAGGSAFVSVTVQANVAGTVDNTASVASTSPDPNTANNSKTTSVTILNANADLSIQKTSAQSTVLVGNNLTYNLVVANAGPNNATGVVVTDTLPVSTSFVSAGATQGSCSFAAPTVTCNLGAIPNGGFASITLVVKVNAGGSIVNGASVDGDQPDPTPGNASSSTSVTANKRVVTLIAKPVVLSALSGSLLQIQLRFEARLADGGTGVPGRPIVFFAGGQGCIGTTNAAGTATCSLTLPRLLASVLRLGYGANFAGDAVYLPLTARGPIVQVLGIPIF